MMDSVKHVLAATTAVLLLASTLQLEAADLARRKEPAVKGQQAVKEQQKGGFQIKSITVWSLKRFVREVPSGKGVPFALYAGKYLVKDKNNRALVVRVDFEALPLQKNAVDLWRSRLASHVPTKILKNPPEGKYRLFDSTNVLLRTQNAARSPKLVATLAETTLFRFKREKIYQIGEHFLPLKGTVGSFGLMGGEEFVSLIHINIPTQIDLVFDVPSTLNATDCQLDLYGNVRKLPEPTEKPYTLDVSIIWHAETFAAPKKVKAPKKPPSKEAAAASKLRLAKLLMKAKPRKARERLNAIVRDYAGTNAAREANSILSKLEK